MCPESEYKFTLINDTDTRVVNPLADQLTIGWELQEDTFFYLPTIGGFKITGDDYFWLKEIEDAGDICKTLYVNVERRCDSGFELLMRNKFTVQNCEWNNAKCNVKINPEADGDGACIIEKRSDQIDILDVVGLTDSADISDVADTDLFGYDNGNLFIYNSPSLADILVIPDLDGTGAPNSAPTVADVMGAGVINPDEEDYIRITLLGTVSKTLAPDWRIYVAWTYRQDLVKVSGQCQPIPPGYALVDDTGPSCSYFKLPTGEDMSFSAPIIGECPAPVVPNSTTIWSCVHVGDPDYPAGFYAINLHKDEQVQGGSAYGTIPLEDVFQPFIDACDIPMVVSDFFQINPENPSSINPVTGLDSHTNALAMIPRGNAIFPLLQNQLIAELSFGELETGLVEMFQTFWGIDLNGNLRYEHYSYFEQNVIGLDLTTGKHAEFTNCEVNYTYKRELLPYVENIFQQEWLNFNWEDRQIKYVDANGDKLNCVGTSELDRAYGVFSNDLEFFVEYPTDGPRTGWVMVATETVTGTGRPWIKDFDGHLNGHLSVKRLVENYYTHGRSALIGTLQGVPITFLSTVRLKEEDELISKVCCDDDFDPRLNIKTPNGIGRIVSAEQELKTSKLTLKSEY